MNIRTAKIISGKTRARAATPLAVAALVLGVSLAFGACSREAATPQLSIKTAAAAKGAISKQVEFSGVLAPSKSVNVYAKLSGQARKVAVDVGDRVSEGELLVQIDTKELNAQLQVAEAALSTVHDQSEQAKGGIESAKLNLEMARKNFDRSKALFDTKVVTQSQLDDASSKLELAKTAFDNASRQFQTVSGSGAQQAEAQANLIRVQISNSTVTSPIAGMVTNRNISQGEITSPSASLMTVADTATLRLQGNVSQEEVMLLKVGGSVRVTIDGMGGSGYPGRIAQVGPIAAATGQYFPVVVTIANDGKLLAGMTAKASFDIEGGPSLVVPVTSLVRKDGQPYVYVVAGGKAALKPVGLGIANGSEVQILSGIVEGEVIAVSNVSLLRDGMEVTP